MGFNWDTSHEKNYVAKNTFEVGITFYNYLRLIRFQYHTTFVSVIFGALYIAKQATITIAESLFMLYLSFNVLLYGGIYTINAIADIRSDGNHPSKSKRPLPAGEVSVKSAGLFSSVLIIAGLLTGFWLFNYFVFYLYLTFLAVNTFYSLVAKKIPYFELLVNASTHPLRFILGVFLLEGKVRHALTLGIFFLAFGLVTARRCVEMDVQGWRARGTLLFYPKRNLLLLRLLAFLAILLISIIDTSTPDIFFWSMLIIYLVVVFGLDICAPLRRVFRGVWTK